MTTPGTFQLTLAQLQRLLHLLSMIKQAKGYVMGDIHALLLELQALPPCQTLSSKDAPNNELLDNS